LQILWYSKLKEEGFKDLEDPHQRLKNPDNRTLGFQSRELVTERIDRMLGWLATGPQLSDTWRNILELYCEGKYIKDIAEQTGVCRWTVRNAINYGIKQMSKVWTKRAAMPDDLEFIYSSWLKSYGYYCTAELCKHDTFFKEYPKVIDYILDQPNINITIACKSDDAETIFGYAVSQPEILHWVFVKQVFWGLGVARDLVGDLDQYKYYTHITQMVKTQNLYSCIEYNPFLLYKRGIDGEK
jgi:DNA-binding CsgD family transcriptional regulator